LTPGRISPNGFKQADRANPGDIAGVLGHIKTHHHMTLCSKMVNLVGLDIVDDLGQLSGI
jgi:hypothetical protein